MEPLALIHIAAIIFWLGVASIEFVIELADIEKSAVVRLHQIADRYV